MFDRLKRLWTRRRKPPTVPKLGDVFSFDGLRSDFRRQSSNYAYSYFRDEAHKPSDLRLLHWVGSVDRSGYTRETCLRWLIEHFEPGDENRILLRLADWVPQIRAVAREWVLANFRDLPFEALREHERLLLFLSRREKLADDPAMEHIRRTVLAAAALSSREEFITLTPKFRRVLCSLSLDADQALRDRVPGDPDPTNRLLLLTHPRAEPLTDAEVRALREDRSAVVRGRFLSHRIAAGEEPSREELIAYALDRHRGVRQLGRFHLKRLHGVDACELYRSRSGEEFYFIADCPRAEDVPHYLEGAKSPRRATRVNCLRALVFVDRPSVRRLDLAPLLSTCSAARRLLLPCLPGVLDVPEILALRGPIEGSSVGGTVAWLRVLAAKSWWHFVDAALVELSADSSRELWNFVQAEVAARTQVFGEPTEDQRRSIAAKLDELPTASGSVTLHRQIAFSIR